VAQYTTGTENPFEAWLNERLKFWDLDWGKLQDDYTKGIENSPSGTEILDWYGHAGHNFYVEDYNNIFSAFDKRMKYEYPEGSQYFYPDTDVKWIYKNFPVIAEEWNEKYAMDQQGYANGGYTGASGGMVHPQEWVVPTLQPENANFLKAVGVDPEVIGAIIADRISDRDIHVHVEIDGGEIGHVVVNQMRTNPEVIEQTRRVTQ